MSHYRSNIRDIEFNLFEVHRIQDHLSREPFGSIDEATAKDILREIDRFSREEWAASFVEADRTPLELVDGDLFLTPGLAKSVQDAIDAGWDKLGLPAELGGYGVTPSVFWATQELMAGANPTALFYLSGPLFARVIYNEGDRKSSCRERV